MSDRLAIIFDVKLNPHIPKNPIRKVCQFHKADKISLKMKAKAVLDKSMRLCPCCGSGSTNKLFCKH